MKNLIILSVIILLSHNLFSQKSERIGIIDMEYILSQMDEYKLANEQLDEKMSNWKDEIEVLDSISESERLRNENLGIDNKNEEIQTLKVKNKKKKRFFFF